MKTLSICRYATRCCAVEVWMELRQGKNKQNRMTNGSKRNWEKLEWKRNACCISRLQASQVAAERNAIVANCSTRARIFQRRPCRRNHSSTTTTETFFLLKMTPHRNCNAFPFNAIFWSTQMMWRDKWMHPKWIAFIKFNLISVRQSSAYSHEEQSRNHSSINIICRRKTRTRNSMGIQKKTDWNS